MKLGQNLVKENVDRKIFFDFYIYVASLHGIFAQNRLIEEIILSISFL